MRKHLKKHDVGHYQSQNKVERLAADVQNQRFPAFEITFQFPKVGCQSDTDKRQAEEPATKVPAETAQYAMVYHCSARRFSH